MYWQYGTILEKHHKGDIKDNDFKYYTKNLSLSFSSDVYSMSERKKKIQLIV